MPPRNVNYTAKQSAGYYAARTGTRASAAAGRAKSARSSALAKTRGAPYVSRRYARVVNDHLGENKYLDTAVLAGSIGSDSPAATLVQSLCIVPQGLTVNSRVGKKLRVMALQVKGKVSAAVGGTSTTGMTLKCAIVWDREPDKAALVPAVGDIYQGIDPSQLTNRDNAPRFKILKEWIMDFPVVTALGLTPATGTQQHIAEYLSFKRKDLEVIWTKADTAGAVAAMIKGDLLFVFVPSNTIAGAAVTGSINCRLDYEDESSKQRK